MVPSYGGTGYLRSSTRRRKTREELIAEQEARNRLALGAPPGSAMERLGSAIDPAMRAGSRAPVVQLMGRPLSPMGRPAPMLAPPQTFPPLEQGSVPELPEYPLVAPPEMPAPQQLDPMSFSRLGARPTGQPALSSAPTGALEAQQEQPGMFDRMFGKTEEGGASPMSLALLSAGLGILANNYGHYGQAGPAIGKGAMQGLQTYMTERDRADKLKQQKQSQVAERAKQEAYARQLQLQDRKAQADEAQAISDEARFRTLNDLPPGMQRDALLEELAVRQGNAGQVLKARQDRMVKKDGPTEQTLTDALGLAGNDPLKQAWARSDPKKFIEEMASLETELRKRNAGGIKITNIAGEKVLADTAMKDLVSEQGANRNRVNALSALDDAVEVVEQGIFTGSAAEFKKGGQKLMGTLFGADTDKAARTEEFISHIGNVVIPALQKLSGPDSDRDVKYLQGVLAGDISLEEKAIRSILAKTRKRIIKEMETHSRDVKEVEKDVRLPGNLRNAETPEQRAARQRREFGF